MADSKNDQSSEKPSEKKKDDDTDVKKVSFTPFVTDLLSPSAKYLGEELKTYVKKKVEDRRNRLRAENLRLHLEALQDTSAEAKKPLNFDDVQDLEFFDSWTDGAQDASPDHPDLFQVWQSILVGVMDRRISDRYIIEKAKQLTPNDARLLKTIRWYGVRALSRARHADLQRLETLGFLTRSNLALWLPAVIFSLPLLVFAARGLVGGEESLGLLLLFAGGMSVLLFWGQIAFGYLAFFAVLAAYPLWNGGSVSSWHLSPMGRTLVELDNSKRSTLGRKYKVYRHPVLGYAAIKVGLAFPALFFGPIWVLFKRLWKVAVLQLAFVLVYAFIYSDVNLNALPLSIRYALALSEKISWPLLLLTLFLLPCLRGSHWLSRRFTRCGYEYVGTTHAQTKLAAIGAIEKLRSATKRDA